MIDSLRQVYRNVIVVDVGDFFGNRMPRDQKTRTKVVVDYMRIAKYAVATIGEKEFNYGLDFLKEQIKQGKFDVVCANLYSSEDSSLIFKPYVIKKVGGIKVAFLGLLDNSPRRIGVYEQLENIYATDYYEAARRYLPELKSKADIVVGLVHIGLGNTRKLAEEIPDFDVLLVGHGADRTPMAEKVGETIILKSGRGSSAIGTLLLLLDEDNRIVAFDGNTQILKKKGVINRDVDRIVKACEEREQQKKRLLARRKFKQPDIPRRPEVVSAQGYLGWETCKLCHKAIYERWSKGPHAKAFATLAEGDKWNDPNCLTCHTTGYEVEAKRDSTDVRPEMWNVQCEACHGMGTKHRRDGTMRQVSKQICLKCHTPKWSPNFSYEEALKKIDHGKDED